MNRILKGIWNIADFHGEFCERKGTTTLVLENGMELNVQITGEVSPVAHIDFIYHKITGCRASINTNMSPHQIDDVLKGQFRIEDFVKEIIMNSSDLFYHMDVKASVEQSDLNEKQSANVDGRSMFLPGELYNSWQQAA